MLPLKSLVKSASVLALGLTALTSPATANDSEWHYVKDMTVFYPGNQVPEIVVHNTADNHLLQNLNLAVQGSSIPVTVGGAVDCLGITSENWKERHGAFLSQGAFGIGYSSLLLSEDIPHSSDIDRSGAMDAHTFQVPVGLLANPQIGVDPIAIVLAAAEQAPSKLDYLRQDQVITVKLPIRWEATCSPYFRNKVWKQTVIEANADESFLAKKVALRIVYQGDPQLYAVNAQLSQGGGQPNQLDAGAQPFKITQMDFQPNMPHHVGACPATTTIRVHYQGQGEGQLRIRINEAGTTIHESTPIAFDSKQGPQHYDFEIATPKASKFDLNKTFNHNLRVYIRGKGAEAASWSANYQLMDAALWKHRCTPQLNPVLGGTTGTGKVGGYHNGGNAGNAAQAQPIQRLQKPSAPPAPTRALRPVESAPTAPRRAQ